MAASLRRLRSSGTPILQCALAAGLAWWVAHEVVGHASPFFAPISAIACLGVSLGSRLRRSIELVAGVTVGLGVGDLLISRIGSGPWQIVFVVVFAMAAAVLLDGGPVIATQAASSAVLVATLLPPGGQAGYDRMIDTLIGGLVGVGVVALVPSHPVKRARRAAAEVLDVAAAALQQTADGLLEQDQEALREALGKARQTQARIDDLRADIRGGRESSRISPLYWGTRQRFDRLTATVDPLDNAVRNIRVLVRRSLTLVRDDEILDLRLIDEVEKLSHALDVVRDMMLADPDEWPDQADAAAVLRDVAKGARPELVADAGLSAHVVFAQLRSALVDLLQVCGVPRAAALAMLPPTVPHPYVSPEPDDPPSGRSVRPDRGRTAGS